MFKKAYDGKIKTLKRQNCQMTFENPFQGQKQTGCNYQKDILHLTVTLFDTIQIVWCAKLEAENWFRAVF